MESPDHDINSLMTSILTWLFSLKQPAIRAYLIIIVMVLYQKKSLQDGHVLLFASQEFVNLGIQYFKKYKIIPQNKIVIFRQSVSCFLCLSFSLRFEMRVRRSKKHSVNRKSLHTMRCQSNHWKALYCETAFQLRGFARQLISPRKKSFL